MLKDGVWMREDGDAAPLLGVIFLSRWEVFSTGPSEMSGLSNELLGAVARVVYLRLA